MPPTLESLGIARLSRDERLALVQAIWDTLATEGHQPFLTEAQRQELGRRVVDDNSNPEDVVPWKEVKRQTLAGLQ